ncbi:TetR family transcriptional regulator [Streptomyces sp. NPDC004296]|uniref:TetR family transcriptional regulator n=1 Tax=Streptomyces sp. NPDC004296 TaxID=3364697 RepID=UPI0036CE45C3
MEQHHSDQQAILRAAGAVFDELGYDRATMYEIAVRAGIGERVVRFLFPSKEDLALAVIRAQIALVDIEPQELKLQELYDIAQFVAHQMAFDPIMRGAARIVVEQSAQHLDRTQSMHGWTTITEDLLTLAREHGELQSRVDITKSAEIFVESFVGAQTVSQAFAGRRDLCRRISTLFSNILESIATPATYERLDLSPGRGEVVTRELRIGQHGAPPAR